MNTIKESELNEINGGSVVGGVLTTGAGIAGIVAGGPAGWIAGGVAVVDGVCTIAQGVKSKDW
ncbi:MAG: hypothetical protein E6920_20265 [Clostridium sp.]|uniref:hypothetical protein n=1 Tax=Paraclostridium sordellii TaxID=1505 RepID=UPI0005E300F2|nr:hypothetical protein [Paeniclostridium sordellii]MDU1404233.1 hypothetical protein [Clostridium sp.]CEP42416.1 Uncharacterised protein [[Clostridium] sordellii] [Paeniclostridium sordellii]